MSLRYGNRRRNAIFKSENEVGKLRKISFVYNLTDVSIFYYGQVPVENFCLKNSVT